MASAPKGSGGLGARGARQPQPGRRSLLVCKSLTSDLLVPPGWPSLRILILQDAELFLGPASLHLPWTQVSPKRQSYTYTHTYTCT